MSQDDEARAIASYNLLNAAQSISLDTGFPAVELALIVVASELKTLGLDEAEAEVALRDALAEIWPHVRDMAA